MSTYLAPRPARVTISRTTGIAISKPGHREVWNQGLAHAQAARVTMSSLVIQALAEYLERHQDPDGSLAT